MNFNVISISTKIKIKENIKMIEIPKINLRLNVLKSDENFNNLNKGLVYYKSFNPNDKIIIFGHSGMGIGTFFNRLDELSIDDITYLTINQNRFKYKVSNIYLVSKKDVYILDEEKTSKKLLLITCDKTNKNKRLVIELVQIKP